MNRRKSVWYCLWGVAVALPVHAQGIDVRGIAVDSTTGERIPFVNIRIPGINRGVATNTNGFYLIANVPYGTFEIVAGAIGYRRQIKTLTVQGTEPITVNFQLPLQPIEVAEVLVEAERKGEPSQAVSVHALSSRDIQQVPVPVQGDVLRAIQILPGIVSTADVSSRFYVRGGAGDQNLILLDGMKIYNPYHAFGIYSIFDPDIINTAEVFTGAFPAGYGGRLSSVLNLTTRNGNTSRLSGKAEINFLATKLQLEGPISGDNSWIVSARKSLFDSAFRHFLRNPTPISFYDVFFKGTLGSSTGRNSFRGFFSGDNVTSDRPEEPNYSWQNQALAFSLSGLISDRVYVDAVAYTSRFKVTRDSKASQLISPAESSVGEDGMRVDLTFYTDSRNLILAGFEFDLPQVDNKFTTPSNIQRTFSSLDPELWTWFRHQATCGALHTDVGIHSDLVSLFNHGFNLQAFQPRMSAGYQLSDLWQLKFSYGIFNQHMIMISNDDDITSLFEAWITIPTGLKYEEAHHYVLGVEGLLHPSLSGSVQSYYKTYPSLVLYNRDKLYPTDPDYVNGTGKSYGAEALLRYGSSPIDLFLAYTLGWVEVTTGGFTFFPRYDRRHTINMMGIVHPLENLDVTLRWEFGSGYPFTQTVGYYDRLTFGGVGGGSIYGETGMPYSILGPKNTVRLPAYYRLDGSIIYRFSLAHLHGSVGIQVANLTDRKNILFYDRKTGQQINMLDFFPSATLKLEF
jgi:hypothetical protein